MIENKMKKICFVVPQACLFFNPEAGVAFGGAERQVYFFGTALAARHEYEVHYCVADFGQGGHEIREGCHLWPVFSFSESKILALNKLLRFLKKVDADIYVFRAANASILPIVLFLKYFLRKKTVYMVAGESTIGQIAQMTNWATAFLMNLTYRFTDVLCVQTNDQLLRFQGRNKFGAKLVPNLFREPSESTLPDKEFAFSLWVGRSDPWKRPELFIELARRNPDEAFVMVCPVGRNLQLFQRLESEALKLPNLMFYEGLSPEQLTHYYRRAKMYVLTSVSEGFSNTMMEAMAASCPIMSLGIDPDAIIRQNQLGLVAETPEDFFRNFKELAMNIPWCRQLGENGRSYLLSNHVGDVVVELFNNALA